MQPKSSNGLFAATFAPLNDDGQVEVSRVSPYVDFLLHRGIAGLYVCGSTGEGPSLTVEERRVVAEAFVEAVGKRVPVFIQVGHNSLRTARSLATHAAEIGADAISATCPSYFKVGDPQILADCMLEVASGAPELPFYYYHIPALTGSAINLVEWLPLATESIPNFVGIKYTDTKLFEYQSLRGWDDGRLDVLWGCDEMLLGAFSVGAQAAIGSTYNFMSPTYQQILEAFQDGDLATARRHQQFAIDVIACLQKHSFQPAAKRLMRELGMPLGGCRLPLAGFPESHWSALSEELTRLGFDFA